MQDTVIRRAILTQRAAEETQRTTEGSSKLVSPQKWMLSKLQFSLLPSVLKALRH
jgi:hypothetical protein